MINFQGFLLVHIPVFYCVTFVIRQKELSKKEKNILNNVCVWDLI